jgi:hypothetical protein
MNEIATPPRCSFIRQMTAAPVGVKIPELFRKGRKQTHTWNVAQWINEFIRTPANSHHVTDKLVPESAFGLAIDKLPAYCDDLLRKAAAQTTEYHRRGKMHVRKQKVSQPVLLCVVTSWPDLQMVATDERKKWLALTTATMQAWYGENLKCGIAHSDEAFYHVHWLVDLDGAPVRRLHAGHAAADAEPIKSNKGEAFRQGCKALIEDYWKCTGVMLDQLRSSPYPRPRLSRSQAQRNRQLQHENEAADLRKRNLDLVEKTEVLAAAQAQHHENEKRFDVDFNEGEQYLNRRLEEIDAAADLLQRERDQVRVVDDNYHGRLTTTMLAG